MEELGNRRNRLDDDDGALVLGVKIAREVGEEATIVAEEASVSMVVSNSDETMMIPGRF